MDLIARFPWWIGVILAVATYFGLHAIATMEISGYSGHGDLGALAGKTVSKNLAYVFQYLLPLILLGGAGLSAIGRWKRRSLHTRIARRSEVDALRELSWQDFEMLVGEAFRRRGFRVSETSSGADGGVDLILRKSGETHLVQCKHWKAWKVGVKVVRELSGVIKKYGATGGLIVTTGEFTNDATSFAQGENIELIGGEALASMIGEVRSSRASHARTANANREAPIIEILVDRASGVPACPKCEAPMIKRTAKRGENAGKPFWGCSQFPKCRGIRSII